MARALPSITTAITRSITIGKRPGEKKHWPAPPNRKLSQSCVLLRIESLQTPFPKTRSPKQKAERNQAKKPRNPMKRSSVKYPESRNESPRFLKRFQLLRLHETARD